MRRKFFIFLLAAMMAGCGYDDFAELTPEASAPQPFNIDIATLRAFYAGKPLTVNEDMVISGCVTTSDKAGNFYRSFVIEDATGAIEVRAGLYDLHNMYPLGQRVTVKLRGITLGMDLGLLQAGAAALPSSYYQTEYLGHRAIVQQYVVREGINSHVVPAVTAIPALREDMCGRLVSVPSLYFAGEIPATWGVPSPGGGIPPSIGYRKFKSMGGDSLMVVSSGYSTFAGGFTPSGNHTITGILLYGSAPGTGGKSVFMLKMRDLRDIAPI